MMRNMNSAFIGGFSALSHLKHTDKGSRVSGQAERALYQIISAQCTVLRV